MTQYILHDSITPSAEMSPNNIPFVRYNHSGETHTPHQAKRASDVIAALGAIIDVERRLDLLRYQDSTPPVDTVYIEEGIRQIEAMLDAEAPNASSLSIPELEERARMASVDTRYVFSGGEGIV